MYDPTSERGSLKYNAEGPALEAPLQQPETSGKRSSSLLIQKAPVCVTPLTGARNNSFKISGIVVTPVPATRFPKLGV